MLQAIAGVWDWAHLRHPGSIERGVRRFRSIEDAQAARRAEEVAQVRALATAADPDPARRSSQGSS